MESLKPPWPLTPAWQATSLQPRRVRMAPIFFFVGEWRRAGRIDHHHAGLGLQGGERHLQPGLPVPCRHHPTGGPESGHRRDRPGRTRPGEVTSFSRPPAKVATTENCWEASFHRKVVLSGARRRESRSEEEGSGPAVDGSAGIS